MHVMEKQVVEVNSWELLVRIKCVEASFVASSLVRKEGEEVVLVAVEL